MSAPTVARTRADLDALLADARSQRRPVALVPTMGALHAGHRLLIEKARERVGATGVVVVSVFVNPLQFGPGEDLERYPRTFAEDLEVCGETGVDVVLAPVQEEMYPDGEPQVTPDPGPLGTVLEGEVRPTHFRGVLTVVAKLFGMVRPDLAMFGQKDYQQLVLVRRMVADLCLGVEVVGVDIVREDDGLALSSRNRFLSEEQRTVARALPEALRTAAADARDPEQVRAAARAVLDRPGLALDYVEVTGPDLDHPPDQGEARLLLAARVGTTRLIDNMALTLRPDPVPTRTRR